MDPVDFHVRSSINAKVSYPYRKETEDEIKSYDKWRVFGGVMSLICMLLSLIAMEEAVQLLEFDYDRPYFLRYMITGGYSLAILEYFGVRCLCRSKKSESPKKSVVIGASFDYNEQVERSFWQKCKRLVIPGIILNLNDMLGGYIWYLSLQGTSVSVNNTIYQSQVAITYALSVIFLNSKVLFHILCLYLFVL